MGKIICEICGTSYPEANAQCPICGCVKPVDTGVVADKDKGVSGAYTYVKGGRFSKKNVKKRIAKQQQSGQMPQPKAGKSSKTTRVVTIVLVLLLLAIVAIAAYVVIDKFSNSPSPDIGATDETTEQIDTDQSPLDIPCTSINIVSENITLESIGQELRIQVSVTPVNTTDAVSYASLDPSIATVDDTGKITAVSEGETTITVVCGSINAECNVVCAFPEETVEIPVTEIKLNRSDFSLFYAGDSWRLYNGEIPASEIIWTSDNEEVVIIELGKVVAVGEGTTNVHAEYDGKKYSCTVRVKFKDAN